MSNDIEFKLFAPQNQKAALLGSFSEWQEIPLQKDERGYFYTSIELKEGIYQYKFRVQSKSSSNKSNEWVEINDPYVTEIDYKTGNGLVRIKNGKKIVDEYVWQHDAKPLPSNEQLVIYELLVSDFCSDTDAPEKQGKYQNAIEKLDYLHELGINAIELMPVNEAPGEYNWGYTPSYFFAPQPNYGATADLKRFIDECHARGIRVILDQVYNHSSEEHPLLHIDRDYWYYRDRHHPNANPKDYWGPEFNYEYKDENLGIRPAWQFIDDVVRFWIHEYHIDGIRYDALKQLDNYDFLYWITQKAKEYAGSKPFYNIGENIPETPKLVTPNGPMDGCWHDSFYHCLQAHLLGETFDLEQLKEVLDPTRQNYPQGVTSVVNYLCNHDHDRLFAELGDRGIFEAAAFERVKLGVAILMTASGVPMIWMGEEFGEYTHKTSSTQQCRVEWPLVKNDLNHNLLEYYKGLIALRTQNPALRTSNIEFFHENLENHVFGYVRWNDEGSRVVVIANFSDRYLGNYCIPNCPANGNWHEWTKDYNTQSANGQLKVDLGAWEAQIFIWH
ncbi:alpha-glucanotransferase [Chlorogloeopsis fritschii PCC 6912]|uniref:Alpha-glucanotransferase n=1 Tax=Chlorogloeopsis fritschii PCC 6912 TaxID=211165 RepID=A0A3S0ZNS3_CHLFR|nr:alpha-amylase family glycosyl hydrolase [Chlorogloeopsis fritschii]RUR74199.1 alpha-glucanotransferase [Chlorogloeopsis fritschii PCC 6912]